VADTIAWILERHPTRLNLTTLYNAACVLVGREQIGKDCTQLRYPSS